MTRILDLRGKQIVVSADSRSSTVWLQLNVNRGSSGIELTRRQVAELRRALFEAQYGEIPRP